MLDRLCPSFLPHVALLVGIKLRNIAYITPTSFTQVLNLRADTCIASFHNTFWDAPYNKSKQLSSA